ncbi:hypothetical protein [Embleya sp. AB8]|uniref:hypothetical protein n=1 Tax=Embleya sp. AB8 TaxID=3156304 RepID=UPI003C76E03D
MSQLDPRTLERLAEFIVDIDGPYNRSGWELERLLEHSGWDPVPPYDGSWRVSWLLREMNRRDSNSDDVRRLVCRLCDAREYDDGMSTANAVRTWLNDTVLKSEQLAVTYVSGFPVLGPLALNTTVYTHMPEKLAERLPRLIADPQVVDVLTERARQAEVCMEYGAPLYAVIGIGSFVEGLLFAVLRQHEEDFAEQFHQNGKPMADTRVSLSYLLDTGQERGYVDVDATELMSIVRTYRNFVHPRAQISYGLTPDEDTVKMCWTPAHAVLNDLERRVLKAGPGT